jgi:hypothetical protein
MMAVATLAPTVIAARALVGLVLLTAAVGKLRDRAAFHGVVHDYRLLPGFLVAPVAAAIPVAEVAVGLLLPSGLLPVPTAAIATAMLLVFVTAMAVNILRGRREIDCGCFRGRPSQRLTWGTVARTGALAAAAASTGLNVTASFTAVAQGLAAAAILFILFATATTLPTLPRKHPRYSL